MQVNNYIERSREIIVKCFSEEGKNIPRYVTYLKYFVPRDGYKSLNIELLIYCLQPHCNKDNENKFCHKSPNGFRELRLESLWSPLTLYSHTCQDTRFSCNFYGSS